MNKDYHSVILSRAKNLENNSVCIQILHYTPSFQGVCR